MWKKRICIIFIMKIFTIKIICVKTSRGRKGIFVSPNVDIRHKLELKISVQVNHKMVLKLQANRKTFILSLSSQKYHLNIFQFL